MISTSIILFLKIKYHFLVIYFCPQMYAIPLVDIYRHLLLRPYSTHPFNYDKTEFALIGTNAQLRKVSISTLRIGDAEVHPSIDPIRNLGVWIDNTFSMKPHLNNTFKSAFFHLHNIRRIRKYPSRDSTEKLLHGFVSNRLYCYKEKRGKF